MRTFTLALSALAACDGGEPTPTGPEPVELAVTATVSEAMPTVVRVAVESSADVPVRIEFGEGEAFDRSVEVVDGEALLVGLPQSTAIRMRATAEGGTSDVVEATTGFLDGAPTVTLDGEPFGQWIALSLMGDTETWAVLLDPEGRVVWAWRDRSGLATFRARVARDGSGLVYNRADADPNPAAALVRVTWEGVETVTSIPELAHDFVDRADGSVVTLGYEVRDSVLANTLVEVAPDGTTSTLWTAWDCLDPVANPGDDPTHGWTHANALDEDEDGWLVGLRNLSTIVKVDPDGTCPWAIGGTGGTLVVTGQAFQHQHQFHRQGDRLLVFDNDGAPSNAARVLDFSLDLDGGTAEQVGSMMADPPVNVFILGDVHRLPDEDLLVAWSTAGAVDRYSPDGTRETRLLADTFGRIGFLDVIEDLDAL